MVWQILALYEELLNITIEIKFTKRKAYKLYFIKTKPKKPQNVFFKRLFRKRKHKSQTRRRYLQSYLFYKYTINSEILTKKINLHMKRYSASFIGKMLVTIIMKSNTMAHLFLKNDKFWATKTLINASMSPWKIIWHFSNKYIPIIWSNNIHQEKWQYVPESKCN